MKKAPEGAFSLSLSLIFHYLGKNFINSVTRQQPLSDDKKSAIQAADY
jgi:hypothetical protein